MARIYPSNQTPNASASGSLLLSIDLYDSSGNEYVNVYVNSVLRDRISLSANYLYSTFLEQNDVVYLSFNNPSVSETIKLNLDRYDYTTDDESDDGIKITNIISELEATGYTFTATTINTAYDFVYVFGNATLTNYQIWTELSQPILTQNNEYINQQF